MRREVQIARFWLKSYRVSQSLGACAAIKAWPNARNISTQHLATLLGTTCCVRLATLLRCVATCWMMLDQIWKRSNFSCNILDVAWCCTRLAAFTQHCCARACAVGPLAIATRNVRGRQRPGAHKQRHVVMNVACVWPARSITVATSCNNVARCCVEMLRAFGQVLRSEALVTRMVRPKSQTMKIAMPSTTPPRSHRHQPIYVTSHVQLLLHKNKISTFSSKHDDVFSYSGNHTNDWNLTVEISASCLYIQV